MVSDIIQNNEKDMIKIIKSPKMKMKNFVMMTMLKK